MTWSLSRFRTGDLVEVRSKEEILATLDQDGCVDGMPFMPEMLQFCGRRFRVRAIAHKTCDTARGTWSNRRLRATVHLDGLYCDGSAHGGCEAECSLFWKDAWLKPVGEKGRSLAPGARTPSGGCTECRLREKACRTPEAEGDEPRYACQATMLYEATEPLAWWDPRHYLLDVVTRNRSVGHVVRVLLQASLRWLPRYVPLGYRIAKALSARVYRRLSGRPFPSLQGKIRRGMSTPTGRLDLMPGELVRIKSQAEIEGTLDEDNKNRGMSIDTEEMPAFCGRVYRVRGRVSRIVDELTGKMRHMKQPCIKLEGVVCSGDYASCRLNCPRGVFAYWREIWLERVKDPSPAADGNGDHTGAARAGGRDAERLPLPLQACDTPPRPGPKELAPTS